MHANQPAQPFSHLLPVDQIPAKGARRRLEADPGERAEIARWLDLMDVVSLSAELELNPMGKTGLIRVNGRLTAEIVQSCVVTLAPVPAHIEEAFSLTFGPQPEDGGEGDEIEVGLDSFDPPDPIIDGAIDMGAVVLEHLALALDPFPRAEGAEFDPPPEPVEAPEPKANPFAVLSTLKQKRE
ncbi:MAG: DUF177 domain-containing protein [Magnetospirillum sp.]|nr:DUF177 domain-containing protein [Magnetospirillum sp.]